MTKTNMFNKVASLFSLAVFAIGSVGALSTPLSTFAAGVNPTISPSTANVSAAGAITITYTAGAAMGIGSTIALSYNSNYTGTLSTANVTVNTAAPSAVNNSTVSTVTTSTLTLSAAISTGATVTIALPSTGFTTPSSAGNYAFIVSSSVGDNGGVFQYVGQANVVSIKAYVPVTLSFVIRDSADSSNTNTCDLGTVTTVAVATCAYRLKVGTNASNGYVISVKADGDLTNGTTPVVNAAAGSTGTAIAAGTETYGAVITPGAITGLSGSITAATAYSAGSNSVAYNNTIAATLLTANKPNSPAASSDTTNTSLVTHKFAISSSTAAGIYNQKVTYTVAPSF